EEIARATRRIEHAKLPKIGKRFTQFTDVLSRGVDALAPRPNNCRPDHFANVELARKMRAERVAFIASDLFALLVAAGVHAILEQRAENLWTYMRPIFRGRFAKAVCFGALAVFAAIYDFAEDRRHLVRSATSDIDPVVSKDGLLPNREKEVERRNVLRQFGDLDAIDWIEQLRVEVVNPKVIEVA